VCTVSDNKYETNTNPLFGSMGFRDDIQIIYPVLKHREKVQLTNEREYHPELKLTMVSPGSFSLLFLR
jgi:hypothetical protein